MAKIIRLRIIDGVVCASTLDIARDYTKRHDHVLRDTERLLEAMNALEPTAPNLGALNWFRLDHYHDVKQELRKCYDMTEEGFALLVGLYTGKEALEWNIAYHAEFQSMKAKLGPAGARGAHELFSRPPKLQADLFDAEHNRTESVGEHVGHERDSEQFFALGVPQPSGDPSWVQHYIEQEGDHEYRITRHNDIQGDVTDVRLIRVGSEDWFVPTDLMLPHPTPKGKQVTIRINHLIPLALVEREYRKLGHGPLSEIAINTLRHYLAF